MIVTNFMLIKNLTKKFEFIFMKLEQKRGLPQHIIGKIVVTTTHKSNNLKKLNKTLYLRVNYDFLILYSTKNKSRLFLLRN